MRKLSVMLVLALAIANTTAANATVYTITELGILPTATSSGARGINNAGQAVGSNYINGDQATIWNGANPTSTTLADF